MAELKKCCCERYTNGRSCDVETNCVAEIDIPVKDAAKNLVVRIKVTGVTRFKIQLKIAMFLIFMACKISGLNCKEVYCGKDSK